MAIFLKDLYYETKNKYHLNLISGGKGMGNIVSWVYVSEDISTSAFLNGGELIITTGVTSGEREDWLWTFIKGLIKQKTSGLILNTGRYIFETDITDDIIRLCQKNSFPLITMPWDTKIFDITHDYYNRIFDDTRDDDNLTGAFQNILTGNTLSDVQTDTLKASGFDDGYYNILHMTCPVDHDTMYILQKACNDTGLTYHVFTYNHCPVVIFKCQPAESISEKCRKIIEVLNRHFPDSDIKGGSGSFVPSVFQIYTSYERACSAEKMTHTVSPHFGDMPASNYCDYNDLGFLKLLLEIKDRQLIDSFINEQLGVVISYDKSHRSALTDTLREYLLQGGSVQKISAKLFCHRNTINYRIRTIREELGYNLDDVNVRFQLMAAYMLMDIQKDRL